MKKTPFNWLQLSTSWVLLTVQLAGQHRDDSLHYYLLVHSLNTKNPYLCVTCLFTTAYIWKPNSWGTLLGYNGILKSFSRDTTDFVVCQLLLFECISIDVYVGKAGVLISFLWSLMFSYSISHGNVDRHANALICVAINLKLMVLKVDFQ